MNQGKFRVAAFGLLALSLASGVPAQTNSGKPAVTAAAPMPKTDRIAMSEFKKLLAADNVVIIDVRSTDAYKAGHIPGALSMPEESLNAATAEKLRHIGKPVATYCSCQAEHTAARAAQTLQRMGVPAQAIVGGFNTWTQEKNPVKTGPDAK